MWDSLSGIDRALVLMCVGAFICLIWQLVGIFVDNGERRHNANKWDTWVEDIATQVDGEKDRSKNEQPPIEDHRRH